jgi:hypothetical protein
MAEKVRVRERGGDMVLAAHYTPIRGRLVAQTVETVRFTTPERSTSGWSVAPSPHVVEQFLLAERDGGTRLEYRGEIAADLWWFGRRWADLVAVHWERPSPPPWMRSRPRRNAAPSWHERHDLHPSWGRRLRRHGGEERGDGCCAPSVGHRVRGHGQQCVLG